VKENFCNLLKKKKLNTSKMGCVDIQFEKEYQIILKTVEQNSKPTFTQQPKMTTNEPEGLTETNSNKQKLKEIKEQKKNEKTQLETILNQEDIEPSLDQIKSNLQEKNVSLSISNEICKSVLGNLIGKNIGTFSSSILKNKAIQTVVKGAMEEELTRILTPKNIDVLGDAMESRAKQEPFVIVFVGLSGVGKSTSLSKICYWLQQNNLKVLIVACDTFKSGSCDLLRHHSKNLNAEFFDKRYGKDASTISNEAIQYAKKNEIDIVLIDTPGRNEPLIKATSKLIVENNPNLVLYVEEAYLGNEGVDQV
jgi:signal recognition particle receptor subunit alpha